MSYLRRIVVLPLSVLLTIFVQCQAQQQPASPTAPQSSSLGQKFVLQDGTPVKLRLSRNVSSADAKTGDTVDFEVLEEIRVVDTVVIPKGGIAWGTVTEAEHKKRMARGGKLDMTIDSVRLVDGEKAALRAVKEAKGGGHTGGMTAGIVATGLIVWPAAPFFLFMHGKDITIPKGTEITAYVNGDFPLSEQKLHLSTPNAATAEPAAPQTTLQISSTPPGADVEIDDSFVGNTPSSVNVLTGEHTVKISKAGFVTWERKIKTLGGNVQLSPALEPTQASQPSSPTEQK